MFSIFKWPNIPFIQFLLCIQSLCPPFNKQLHMYPGWPQTHYITKDDLELSTTTSQMLGLKVCVIWPGLQGSGESNPGLYMGQTSTLPTPQAHWLLSAIFLTSHKTFENSSCSSMVMYTEIHLPLPLSAKVKGVHHHTWP